MNFASLPEEARPLAKLIEKDFRKRKLRIALDKAPWSNSPYCPSLTVSNKGSLILVELQWRVQYHSTFKDFVRWVSSNRFNAEIYVATHKDGEIPAKDLHELTTDGVGLLLLENNGNVTTQYSACNPALVVNYDPSLKFGTFKLRVEEAVKKFNKVNRKDGLKDMCELVEELTESLLLAAIKKGKMKTVESAVDEMNFSTQINALGSSNAFQTSIPVLFDDPFKQDMHSFRGARNLLNHKVKNKQEEYRRKLQYHDKMVMGPRLVAELLSFHRIAKR